MITFHSLQAFLWSQTAELRSQKRMPSFECYNIDLDMFHFDHIQVDHIQVDHIPMNYIQVDHIEVD